MKNQIFTIKKNYLIFLSLLFSFNIFAQNQTFPNKPIHFIVPFAPGGSTDVTARIIGQKLSELLKQAVIVENRAGAGASIGIQYVANSAPDGYTILVVSPSIIVNAVSGTSSSYKPQDFEVVSFASNLPMGIFVNEKVPANNLDELKQVALKDNLSFATAGTGTPPSITCENLFRIIWKANVTHIPYKGSSPALLATVSGETPITCGAMTGVTPFHKQGKVKVLAVSSEKRLASLPNVPTVIEAGYPQLRDDLWTGIFVPKNTPVEIKQKLNQAINLALQFPDVIEKLDGNDLVPMGGSLEENSTYFSSEIARWIKNINAIKAK
jgi:tripartite-type tricarboxylate transporter receptor subunit TctC